MAIFELKQTVHFYHDQDTPVYVFFLNAKKAFDVVNHRVFATLMLESDTLLRIVKLFIIDGTLYR